jgi:hypothetical protein
LFSQSLYFGDKFYLNDIKSINSVIEIYNSLDEKKIKNLKFEAKVNSVCKVKGCWMNLDLENGQEIMVNFKDYSFFVPKDIEGKKVIVQGKASIEILSVKQLQHYAYDAGKTDEEIKKIVDPKKVYSFEAKGVLIK